MENRDIALFRELILCGNELYTWCYDISGGLLWSNCPDEGLLEKVFQASGCKEKALRLCRENPAPMVLGTGMGLIWGVESALREEGERMYVIGPAFFSDVSMRDIQQGFDGYQGKDMDLRTKYRMLSRFSQIPTVENALFVRYLLMLHYCLTGCRLSASDIAMPATRQDLQMENIPKDRHKVWLAEQALLQMVKNGDLNYRSALDASMLLSSGVPVKGRDPLRQAKTSTVVFTTLVCRAAIDGGLTPEEAYALGDSYIQQAENSRTYDEVSALPMRMYDDFVRRVHRCRVNPRLSVSIQTCCDYIEMHTDEKIRAADLARLVGYTEYYLTHKFRQETGFTVSDYVKNVKIERAKVLLKSSRKSIQEIAEELAFGTRNYFTRVFTQVVGLTPAQFRQR